jgi:uncharacterized membrane protein YphA (DoxX/SURF4 family)
MTSPVFVEFSTNLGLLPDSPATSSEGVRVDIVLLVGRILFAALFIGSGIRHFKAREAMTGYAKYKGIPAAGAAVVLSGLVFLLGGLGVLLGVYAEYAALALAVAVALTAFTMHTFWKETDPQAKMTEQVSFNKNLALAGGALAFYVLFANYSDSLAYMLLK